MTRPDEPDELDDTVLVRRGRHAPATEARVDDDTVLVRRPGAPRAVPEDDTVVRVRPVPPVAVTGSAPPSPGAPPAPAARVHLLRVGSAAHRLDAPVVVGRRPSAPRVSTGAPAVLVAVPSPTSEVSSSHVRVEQVGSTVVVIDLRSTNGTVVTLPGRHPVTLRQGESTVALAGTIVDVGDGNLLEVLPPPRPAAQEGRRP
ncbi:FHA domain-containing protein [Frigoribacterium faeni]|uniref:FHA domain-containing protein n=1 Tax=Frigoribacterium faeni TaxID=145483 RepID=UPI00141BA74F|nr:hypothetical protein [Frigoribacterium faeni]